MANSGPGRSYRQGLSVMELFEIFPDEQAARAWFENNRWPDGERYCPRCRSYETSPTASGKPMPYWCRSCRRHFSVKVGTVMESSNLPLRKWLFGMYLMTTSLKGVSSMKLHRDLGITQKSAWFMSQRIREGWMRGSADRMSGEIEVDETYVGGKERNRHPSRRRGIRGPSGKTVVVGAMERDGEIRAQRIERTDAATLQGFVARNVQPGSTVYTDEHRSYRRMPGVRHRAVNHGVGEYVDGQAHVNGMESFWSLLKRGYHGTFHHVSEKHLDRYVTEFAGRQSRRDLGTLAQMAMLARTMDGRRITYGQLIADGEGV